MRNYIIGLLSIFSIFLSSCSEKKDDINEKQLIGMRTSATGFMKELKGILIQQIKTGGVLQAVSVCSDTAQVLTNNYGVEQGIYIKRVSLKNRNPNNYPDDFEKSVLIKFELLHQNNSLNNETEIAEIVSEGDFNYMRYLKPIIVQAECLNCHGSEADIIPDVKNLIAQKYPDDKAIGYTVGDIRGAISIKKVVE